MNNEQTDFIASAQILKYAAVFKNVVLYQDLKLHSTLCVCIPFMADHDGRAKI